MDILPFNTLESLAVARLVWDLIFSDNKLDRRESDFFEQMLQSMNLTSEKFESSLSDPIDHSYEVVRKMPVVKRRECGRLLRLVVDADHNVALSELSRLNEIIEQASIFRPDKQDAQKGNESF
jgi:hypothetical protein